jgi:hypothetical protein
MANFVIRKDQTNNVVLTLRERSQLVNPYYLFEFIHKFSDTIRYASFQNQASSNIRYDLLVMLEGVDPDPLDGEIRLIEGEWSYNVYESVSQTLDVAETTGRILQTGLIIVTDGDI